MNIKLSILLLGVNIGLLGMDQAGAPSILSPKSTPQGMQMREMVIAYLQKNESQQAAAEPVKNSNYYKQELSSSQRNLVNLSPGIIRNEVLAGPLDLKENKGVLCAAHTLFLINIVKNTIFKTINIPSKMESSDLHRPTPCCVKYAKLSGIDEDQILVGELDGRVLIADPQSHLLKTFGHLPGRVLAFFVDDKGEKIGVKYESKDADNKSVPCFALAEIYESKISALHLSNKSLAPNLAQSAINKRRSWAPPLHTSGKFKTWSDFAVQHCTHEVRDISFEEGYCVTHCATGNIEKWIIQNIDTAPELVKISQIEQRQP